MPEAWTPPGCSVIRLGWRRRSSAAIASQRAFGLDRGMPFALADIAQTGAVRLVGSNIVETMPPDPAFGRGGFALLQLGFGSQVHHASAAARPRGRAGAVGAVPTVASCSPAARVPAMAATARSWRA